MASRCTIRQVFNDVVNTPRYLDIPINASPPFTQDQVGDALLAFDSFASPIQNYSFAMGNSIDIQHVLLNHERLAIYQTKFDKLAEKVEYLKNARIQDQKEHDQEKRQREKEKRQEEREREEVKREREEMKREWEQEKREREQEKREREQEKREREHDEKILLEYEVYDRIAQGLDDYLIDQLDVLAHGVVVASKVNYLPLLMTAWWFMSDPIIYTLPNCLQDLPEDVTARFQNKKYKYLIDENLDQVAAILWNDYERECLVMMACFTHRPSQRTPVAHRCPTVTAARAQINNSSLFEDAALKNIALDVLKMKGLFDSTKDAAGI